MREFQSEPRYNSDLQQSELKVERESLERELKELNPKLYSQTWRVLLSVALAVISYVSEYPSVHISIAIVLALAFYLVLDFKRLLELILLYQRLSIVKRQMKSWDRVISDYNQATKSEDTIEKRD
jgi:predicted PurR-regulated permease PerM